MSRHIYRRSQQVLALRALLGTQEALIAQGRTSVIAGVFCSTLQKASSCSKSSLCPGQHIRGFAAPAEQPSEDTVHLTENAVQRIRELLSDAEQGSVLRLTVEAGGCSGFSYKFDLDSRVQEEDRVFESGGVRLVADDVSYEFVKGATVDFSQELIKSAFEVVENPNADKGCGCGTSFAPK